MLEASSKMFQGPGRDIVEGAYVDASRQRLAAVCLFSSTLLIRTEDHVLCPTGHGVAVPLYPKLFCHLVHITHENLEGRRSREHARFNLKLLKATFVQVPAGHIPYDHIPA